MTEQRNVAGPICKNFCDGCPCLKTENKKEWVDTGDDWMGWTRCCSTIATCTLNQRQISDNWRHSTETPNWCPVIGK